MLAFQVSFCRYKILIIINLAFHSFFLCTTASATLLSLVTRKLDSRRTQNSFHMFNKRYLSWFSYFRLRSHRSEDAGHIPLMIHFVYITYFLEMLAFQASVCLFIIYNNRHRFCYSLFLDSKCWCQIFYYNWKSHIHGLNFFSSPCQRQCELLPSLGVRRPLTFHILRNRL
jgi:hypothetical protein